MTREQEHDHKQRAQAGSFKIVDRRRFSATGELRADAPADPPRSKPPVAPSPQPVGAAAGRPAEQAAPRTASPGPRASASSVDFLSFVSSLASNAMAAMGVSPNPQSRPGPQNLNMAREYIEIIVMLQERTVGNLGPEEEHAMTQLIESLGQQFMALQRPAPPAGAPVRA